MNVYVGASMNGKHHAKEVVSHLVALGAIITSRWHDAEVHIDLADDKMAYAKHWSEMDTADLLAANTCVFVNLAPSSSGGMWVEFGLAIAMGKNIILIGPRASVFTWVCQQFDSIEEFKRCLIDGTSSLPLRQRLLQWSLRFLFSRL